MLFLIQQMTDEVSGVDTSISRERAELTGAGQDRAAESREGAESADRQFASVR